MIKYEVYDVYNVDYDSLWKDVIEDFFEEFLLFFAPDLFEQVDRRRGFEFLEQELRKLYHESETNKKIMDKLVKVYLKNGEDKWILIHIEVQGTNETDFSKRMFQYFYRAFDKYDQQIYAIALFTDFPNEKAHSFSYI
ncbi:hypothetical protein BKP45_07110 [Anaerobacillus alkalidiazotrophicus]|uniref:Transposase (putative) YhgA-like domain-containing protein n=1 Tax=Anaerobacillus alkalidiazotrophicus TaxID=472963 RepID=A0A1S2MCC3_9BACI|nr:hypothetical protein [Anaerobacillus alkalidiazotrophicus]OIJ22398.1 hypothetical protein BKP45_07110 [Anaerobacillus alkalidiazotrophicus]